MSDARIDVETQPDDVGRSRKSASPVRVVAGVAWSGDRILVTQRPPRAEHALEWEFPGGKIEPGESAERALIREIREELGVDARPLGVLATHRHEYPSGLRVEIVFLEFEPGSHTFHPSAAVHAARWVRPGDLNPEELLAADRPFLEELVRTARKDPEREG